MTEQMREVFESPKVIGVENGPQGVELTCGVPLAEPHHWGKRRPSDSMYWNYVQYVETFCLTNAEHSCYRSPIQPVSKWRKPG
jgi:hypothetical protein